MKVDYTLRIQEKVYKVPVYIHISQPLTKAT